MKTTFSPLLFLIMTALACSSSKETVRTNVFNFDYQGDDFQILSMNSATGEGVNVLRSDSYQNEKAYARDIDQDGVLDILVYANTNLEELNAIYQTGILEASKSNLLQEKVNQRVFEFETLDTLYTITGYYLGDENYNVFTIQHKESEHKKSYIDFYADGDIDDTSISENALPGIQKKYMITLERGINERSIEYINGMYIVLKNEEILAYR